ncbi:uncharacterized protein BYT42DRAFT_580015 [Radiomyces spectabilis]|uniref:uncharacterized protein n=1 Tax=Radiomyces spectabilis TaxID=64574 RepID=UPI00221FC62C|nr:uncharacterized protein BYT42DRAFT_580015 [Radiomyces spectabilis]KAI8371373.1 hypothetical protein BYT42DRAFT_580015 [Radiomyces spectabilis]
MEPLFVFESESKYKIATVCKRASCAAVFELACVVRRYATDPWMVQPGKKMQQSPIPDDTRLIW